MKTIIDSKTKNKLKRHLFLEDSDFQDKNRLLKILRHEIDGSKEDLASNTFYLRVAEKEVKTLTAEIAELKSLRNAIKNKKC